ncbi:hypothetical protein E4U09_005468 [Claviceps aff. purpurea]|uniref:Uncharacterized protein n=1 Tax=Claviceps aff. purpurea TaxID=1967640 RepID=A0A9P7QBU7_9HYPO|nr:hypothetical protein E4U09_005468 [Claviceps aff. purpurea]
MAERTHTIFPHPVQYGQTVSQAPRWEPTTKISITHRNLIYQGLKRRYEELQELQDRAREHAAPDLHFYFDAGIMPSTPPTEPTEPTEPLEYAATGAGVPWRIEAQRAEMSDTPGEAEDYQDVGTYSGASGSGVANASLWDCRERDAIKRALDRKIEMLDQDPGLDHLSPESDTFAGILEELLDHLEAHCCPRDDAASEQMAASEGSGRQADDLHRHHACVSFKYMECLQKHIDQLWYFQFDDNMSSMRRTRQSSPQARAAMRNSRGVSSPLVDGYTPD